MKHILLIKENVLILYPPLKGFYIKTFPMTHIFHSMDLKEWTVLNWALDISLFVFIHSVNEPIQKQ